MNRRYLNAVIICQADDQAMPEGKKFHDIMNVESRIIQFCRLARRWFPDAKYVNFYYKPENDQEKGRNFAFRRYID
jgi:hypothetical protein